MNIFLVNMNHFVPCLQALNGIQKRQARHLVFQNFCRNQGYGEISWSCPVCGKNDHGVPSGHGLCISTSTVEHWSALVIARTEQPFGFDLAHKQAPKEANGIADLFFSPGEQRQRPPEGWNYGSRFAEIWAHKEALGKMHRTGLMDDQPGKEGSILDSHSAGLHYRQIMLNHSHGLPRELIGCIVMTSATREQRIHHRSIQVKKVRSELISIA